MKFSELPAGQKFTLDGTEYVKLKPCAVNAQGELFEIDDDEEIADETDAQNIPVGDCFTFADDTYVRIEAPCQYAKDHEVWALDEHNKVVIFDADCPVERDN